MKATAGDVNAHNLKWRHAVWQDGGAAAALQNAPPLFADPRFPLSTDLQRRKIIPTTG